MGSEAAPEFIFDQGVYYPVAGNYYGYYCTGMEAPSEWGDHQRVYVPDAQGLHYMGLQTESLPYVYFAPSYGYAQSSNTYNPYMPGAVIGIDGQCTGAEQYFANPSYEQAVFPPAYIPPIVQSTSDVVTNSSRGLPFITNGASIASHRSNTAGTKYTPSLAFSNAAATSQRVTLGSAISEPSNSSVHHIQASVKLSKGSLVNAAASKQSLSHGAMTAGSAPHVTQAANHFRNGSVSSVHGPLGVTMPSNNGYTNLGSSVCGLATVPRLHFNVFNASPNLLAEQNKGPRTNKSKDGSTPGILVQGDTTKAGSSDMQGNIIINADRYNRDDFLVDYPDAKFFVIKSYTEDDVHKSIKYNVWSSTPNGNKKLDIAYEDAQRINVGNLRKCPVFLFFSVNTSGQFCGVAEMIGRVDFYKHMDFWQQNKWIGSFPVKWHIVKDVPNTSLRNIILENNEYIPVTSSRDTQEIPHVHGLSMLKIFQSSPLNTSILDDFLYYEERERIMREQKSRLIGRRTSLFLPVFVPSNVASGTADQSPKAIDKQLNGADEQPPRDNEKHPNGSVDQSLNSDGEQPSVNVDQPPKDGRKMDDAVDHLPEARKYLNDTVVQSFEEDGKVSTGDVELITQPQNSLADQLSQSNGSKSNCAVDKPSKVNGKLLDVAGILPSGSDEKQLNLAVNQHPKPDGKQPNSPVHQPLKADGKQKTDRNHTSSSDPKISGEVSPGDEQVIPKLVSVDPSDVKEGVEPAAVNFNVVDSTTKVCSLSSDSDNCSSVATDVVTVGSMHINLDKHSESFRRIFTVGSIPVIDKGLKFKKKA